MTIYSRYINQTVQNLNRPGRIQVSILLNSDSESSRGESGSSDDESIINMAAVRPIKKKISPWSSEGLDLSEASFAKLYAKECKYEDSKELYDLDPETFTTFRNNLIDKMNTIHGKGMMTAVDNADPNNIQHYLVLTEYTNISKEVMEASRNARWPNQDPNFADQSAADEFTDAQIKASLMGEYLYTSLTESAKNQLRGESEFYEVKETGATETYRDGPSLFWKIADLVDPDNESMIEQVKNELRELHVKDFGYSVIKMFAHCRILMKRLVELGGTYSDDEKFLDFWKGVRTMKEDTFSRFVEMEKDTYNETRKANRKSHEEYMRLMQRKETVMRNEDKWNKMSANDTMLMALVNMIEQQEDASNKRSKQSNNNKKEQGSKDSKKDDKSNDDSASIKGDSLSAEEKARRKENKIPDWKKEAPAAGTTTSKIKDGRTYHWCGNCRDGKGMGLFMKKRITVPTLNLNYAETTHFLPLRMLRVKVPMMAMDPPKSKLASNS